LDLAGVSRVNLLASWRAMVIASVTMPTQSPNVAFPAIRLLGPADLDRCVALSVDRGWLPEKSKWSLLLAASQTFGIDAPDGRGLAGAVALSRWDADYASVGMMLVAVRYQRRGLGKALMEHLLAAAGPGATVTLFATDMGRPLYEKLGFKPVRRNVSFLGRLVPGRAAVATAVRARTVRDATPADLPAILAADRVAFGADRGPVLSRLPVFAERLAVIGDPAGGIAGYAAAWSNHVNSTVIGPLVAADHEAAARLVTHLAAGSRTPIRLDLDPDRPELPAWAKARGLEPVARTLVMAHGEVTPRGTPERLFTPISVALALSVVAAAHRDSEIEQVRRIEGNGERLVRVDHCLKSRAGDHRGGGAVGPVRQRQDLDGRPRRVLDDPVLGDAKPGVLGHLAQPVRPFAAAARRDDLRHEIQLRARNQPGRFVDDRRPRDLTGNDEHVRLAHAGRSADFPFAAVADYRLGTRTGRGTLDDPGKVPQRPVVP